MISKRVKCHPGLRSTTCNVIRHLFIVQTLTSFAISLIVCYRSNSTCGVHGRVIIFSHSLLDRSPEHHATYMWHGVYISPYSTCGIISLYLCIRGCAIFSKHRSARTANYNIADITSHAAWIFHWYTSRSSDKKSAGDVPDNCSSSSDSSAFSPTPETGNRYDIYLYELQVHAAP